MAIMIKVKPKVVPVEWSIFKFGGSGQVPCTPSVNVLGGKGANLAVMSQRLGIPVPPGFIIPTDISIQYRNATTGASASTTKKIAISKAVRVKAEEGMTFLDSVFGYSPLVSVRSGSRVSMPGMMDTILNVGLTNETLPVWSERIGVRAALDSYRRLIQMLSSVALGVPSEVFEEKLLALRQDAGVSDDSELDEVHLKTLVNQFLETVLLYGAHAFPQTLHGQLNMAIQAVFKSWDSPRAKAYRSDNGYSEDWGTAVTVQSMVFGNLGDHSATGVVFSRCPSSGASKMTGEFLINAQGEDVVAGIRTPLSLDAMQDWNKPIYQELAGHLKTLECHYRDMQDVEFTVQEGKLYILQTRNGKRTPQAAFEIAYSLANEGLIDRPTAISRVTQAQLFETMRPRIDPDFTVPCHLTGIAAGGGLVSGVAVFTAQDAVNCTEPCILVSRETTPEDYSGMSASVGILTQLGGLTSHAAVVARGMGKSCVVGCTDMLVKSGAAYLPDHTTITHGMRLTIDGVTGNVWINTQVPVVSNEPSEALLGILSWARGSGLSERITPTATMNQEDLVELFEKSEATSIYVDTAILTKDRYSAKKKMIQLGEALKASKSSEIVIDLRGMEAYQDEFDASLCRMFCESGKASEEALQNKVSGITTWQTSVKCKVSVRMPEDTADSLMLLLSANGVRVSRKISNFGDLLTAEGPVEITEEAMLQAFGSLEGYETALKMVGAMTGKSLFSDQRRSCYWFEVLHNKTK